MVRISKSAAGAILLACASSVHAEDPWGPSQTTNCDGGPACSVPGMASVCKTAYERYANGVNYNQHTVVTSSSNQGGRQLTCAAQYVCERNLFNDISGEQIKLGFSAIQSSTIRPGCGSCGQHVLANTNCWLSLQGCENCNIPDTNAGGNGNIPPPPPPPKPTTTTPPPPPPPSPHTTTKVATTTPPPPPPPPPPVTHTKPADTPTPTPKPDQNTAVKNANDKTNKANDAVNALKNSPTSGPLANAAKNAVDDALNTAKAAKDVAVDSSVISSLASLIAALTEAAPLAAAAVSTPGPAAAAALATSVAAAVTAAAAAEEATNPNKPTNNPPTTQRQPTRTQTQGTTRTSSTTSSTSSAATCDTCVSCADQTLHNPYTEDNSDPFAQWATTTGPDSEPVPARLRRSRITRGRDIAAEIERRAVRDLTICGKDVQSPSYNSWTSTGGNSYSPFYSYSLDNGCKAYDWTLSSGVVGVAGKTYATEHIYEIQQVKDFIVWIVKNDPVLKAFYDKSEICTAAILPLLFSKTQWAPASFYGGTNTPVVRPIDDIYSAVSGGSNPASEFVYLDSEINGLKGTIFGGGIPGFESDFKKGLAEIARAALVFEYMNKPAVSLTYKTVSTRVRAKFEKLQNAIAASSKKAKFGQVNWVGGYDLWEAGYLDGIQMSMRTYRTAAVNAAKTQIDVAKAKAQSQGAKDRMDAMKALVQQRLGDKLTDNVFSVAALRRP